MMKYLGHSGFLQAAVVMLLFVLPLSMSSSAIARQCPAGMQLTNTGLFCEPLSCSVDGGKDDGGPCAGRCSVCSGWSGDKEKHCTCCMLRVSCLRGASRDTHKSGKPDQLPGASNGSTPSSPSDEAGTSRYKPVTHLGVKHTDP